MTPDLRNLLDIGILSVVSILLTYLFFGSIWRFKKSKETKCWPTVEGDIIKSEHRYGFKGFIIMAALGILLFTWIPSFYSPISKFIM